MVKGVEQEVGRSQGQGKGSGWNFVAVKLGWWEAPEGGVEAQVLDLPQEGEQGVHLVPGAAVHRVHRV